MKTLRHHCCLCGLVLLAACAKKPPPISVFEFMENPRVLEATMVRCGENRAEMKYEGDCMNARDAVNRLEVREKEARKAELEALSERKRQALRRTQQAAAEARRRAVESEKQREAAEYLGVSEARMVSDAPAEPNSATNALPAAASNVPGVQIEIPEADNGGESTGHPESESVGGSELQSIREELKRRQEDPELH